MAQRAPCEAKKRTLVVLSWCNVIWVVLSIYHLVGFTSELLTSASASFELWYLYCRTASTVFLSLLLKLVLLQVAVARLAAVESALKIELFKFPLSKRNSVNQIVHIDWIINKLASSVDAIAISKIWKHYSLTDPITWVGARRCYRI